MNEAIRDKLNPFNDKVNRYRALAGILLVTALGSGAGGGVLVAKSERVGNGEQCDNWYNEHKAACEESEGLRVGGTLLMVAGCWSLVGAGSAAWQAGAESSNFKRGKNL